MILKAAGTLMQRHASPACRHAPSADRYATPVNFEEPPNRDESNPSKDLASAPHGASVQVTDMNIAEAETGIRKS